MKRTTDPRTLLLLGALLLPSCQSGDSSELSGIPLRLATWNLRHGVGMDKKLDLERQSSLMEAWGADLIALQEMDVSTRRSGAVDQPRWLGQRLEMASGFAPFMAYDGGQYGLALLSALPIRNSEVLDLPPGPEEPRSVLVSELALGAETILVVVAHFDWLDDDRARVTQATQVLEHLEARRALPTIVLGDLNDEPSSRTLRLFADRGFERVDTGSDGTWEAPAPSQIIDHVLVRRGATAHWQTLSAVVVPEPLRSDHRPVLVDLRLVIAARAR